jgi:hypothetical protein
MVTSTCQQFLTEYLGAICKELARRHLAVYAAWVHPPMPQQALGVTIELGSAPARPTEGARRGDAAAGGRIHAGWHEELGWWAERGDPAGLPGADRRYFSGDLLPAAEQVADFLAGVARHQDLGSAAPSLHRYRLLGDLDDVLDRLSQRTAAPARPASLL